ncbi:MAG: DivIVA domain-containing protein [Actinomycetota bacterium]
MKEKEAATSSGFGSQNAARLTPADVQQKAFRISFRGYNERDVDEFLDHVTEELQRYEAEVMRLRTERASFDPASFDLDAEQRRILSEAQERADAVVREAEARAAGIPTAPASDTRAVVAPYLNREREFLQSLGSLVQEHAQTIKTMVEEARRRSESMPEPEPTPAPIVVAEPTASAPVASRTDGEDRQEPSVDETGERGVVVLGVDEPVAASAERPADEREPEGARSLRELFWGED